MCHTEFPTLNLDGKLDDLSTWLLASTFAMREALGRLPRRSPRSRRPKRRENAKCSNSVRCWAGNNSTAYRCHAVSIAWNSYSDSVARETAVTTAPNSLVTGSIFIAILCPMPQSRGGDLVPIHVLTHSPFVSRFCHHIYTSRYSSNA